MDGNDGIFTLREAVLAANATAGHQLIVFDGALSGTITLGSQLTIDSDVTIEGPGAATLAVDGDGSSRIFYIDDDANVEISGLTLTGGDAGDGGAIFSDDGSVLTLVGVELSGNSADDDGGAIFSSGEALTVIDCVIDANQAGDEGGAINTVAGRTLIEGTTISGNKAGNTGAGVTVRYNVLDVVESEISGNRFSSSSGTYGGGIYVASGSTTTIVDSVIQGNKGDGVNDYSAVYGGGIAVLLSGSRLFIENSAVEGNDARSGGGLYAQSGEATISGTAFEANTVPAVGGRGGGIYVGRADVDITDSLLYDNDAEDGAGLYLYGGTVDMVATTVSGNVAADACGGILVTDPDSAMTITNGTITANTAAYGGGIGRYNASASVILNNTIVAGNTGVNADDDLKGSFDSSSAYNLIGKSDGSDGFTDGWRGNQVGTVVSPIDPLLGPLADNGGPTKTHLPASNSPAVDAAADFLVDTYYDQRGEGYLRDMQLGVDIGATEYSGDVIIVSNNSDVDDGNHNAGELSLREAIGLANASSDPNMIVFDSTLLTGQTITLGGTELAITTDVVICGLGVDNLTIDADDSSRIFAVSGGVAVRISGLTLTGGSVAAGNDGGAVSVEDSDLVLRDVRLIDNTAGGDGGALYVADGSLDAERVEFLENTASSDGGAFYAVHSDVVVNDSRIVGNTSSAGGGGLYMSDGSLEVLRSEISDNEAASNGGGAYLNCSSVLRQVTVSGNSAAANGGGIYGSAELLGCTVTNNSAVTGGGLDLPYGSYLLHNTVVAENTATTSYPDIAGTVLPTSSYNFIGDGTGMTGITDGTSGNQIGTGVSPIDPGLGPLAFNGGATRTHAPYLDSPLVDAGDDALAIDRSGSVTKIAYDDRGYTSEVTQIVGQDDDLSSETDDVTTAYEYDAAGQLTTSTCPLGYDTTYTYDALGRKTSETNAEDGVTEYDYDALGRLIKLTDPEDNETTWTYGVHGQVATETINVNSNDLTRYFYYDSTGNLIRKVDREDRVIDYEYDNLSRPVKEEWYNSVADADGETNVQQTYTTTYDVAGRTVTEGDSDYAYEYGYTAFGDIKYTLRDYATLSDDYLTTYGVDAAGRITSIQGGFVSGGTPAYDYADTISYDALGRVTKITQADYTPGTPDVASKRVDYVYDELGNLVRQDRWADLEGTEHVAQTDRVFDELGRLDEMTHHANGTDLTDYGFSWDKAGNLTSLDWEGDQLGSDAVSYNYDHTGQLTYADYDALDNESYAYDDAGNRTNTGYSTGDHNRLASDGTYNFTYDDEGNLASKTKISDSTSVEYEWDHRNRLTKVTFKDSGGTPTKIVEYAYDCGNRWVRKVLNSDGVGDPETQNIFVYDRGQIVLDFEGSAAATLSGSDAAHRYLWGAGVDELLAEETIDDGSADDVLWALPDHQGSVRTLVEYDPAAGTTSTERQIIYDAFGNIIGGSDPAPTTGSLFLYTARPTDPDTGLQNNLNRWYDASIGRWISMDPIGFAAGDVNLYRYVGNGATVGVDPQGLLDWERCKCGGKHMYRSLRDTTLTKLAEEVGADASDWVCIWPVFTGTGGDAWAEYDKSNNGKVGECATADVSNLKETKGEILRMAPALTRDKDIDRGGRDHYLYWTTRFLVKWKRGPFERWNTGPGAAGILVTESKQGKTPIGELYIAAHSDLRTTLGALNDKGKREFSSDDIFGAAESPNNNKNKLALAKRKVGPPKCWFTRTAEVWGAGCKTQEWARDWADRILRKGATVHGTKHYLWASNKGMWFTEDNDKGTPLYPGEIAGSFPGLLNVQGWVPKKGTQ